MVEEKICRDILITGANGLVGFEVLKELLDSSIPYKIKALVRKAPHVKFDNIDYITGDLTEKIPENLFPGKKFTLLHFAGKMKGKNLDDLRKTNVTGLRRLLESYNGNIEKIIFGSSMSVYGQGPFNGVTETESLNPETDLAITRKEAETLILDHSKKYMSHFIILRPRFIFGERDRETLPTLLKLNSKGILIGTGEQKFSFIHVNDYAKIVCRLLDIQNGDGRILNISYPTPLTLNELNQMISSTEIKLRIPIGSIIKYGKHLPILSKIRTKLQLIGQDQVLNTDQLQEFYPEIKSIDSKKSIKDIIHNTLRKDEI